MIAMANDYTLVASDIANTIFKLGVQWIPFEALTGVVLCLLFYTLSRFYWFKIK